MSVEARLDAIEQQLESIEQRLGLLALLATYRAQGVPEAQTLDTEQAAADTARLGPVKDPAPQNLI